MKPRRTLRERLSHETVIAPEAQTQRSQEKETRLLVMTPIDQMEVKVLLTQSCPTLCNPMDCSPPGSSVHGIPQARILEPIAIPFSTIHNKHLIPRSYDWGFPGGSVVKNPPANTGDTGLIPDLGRSPRGGNGNPFQYSYLNNPMNRGNLGGLQSTGSQRVRQD